MNREIKFRAWDNIKKRWLTDNDTVYLSDEGYCFTLKTTNYNGDYLSKEDVEINLFTGLKDKNGIEIYEGDIVSWKAGIMYGNSRICFYSGGFRLQDYFDEDNLMNEPFANKGCEIIGNIYENPELIQNV